MANKQILEMIKPEPLIDSDEEERLEDLRLKKKIDAILAENIEVNDEDGEEPQIGSDNEEGEERKTQNIINGYEIINYIGQGAFGKVYLCR